MYIYCITILFEVVLLGLKLEKNIITLYCHILTYICHPVYYLQYLAFENILLIAWFY